MPRLSVIEAVLLALPMLASLAVLVAGVAVARGRIRPPAAWTTAPADVPVRPVDETWAAFYRTAPVPVIPGSDDHA